VAATEEAPQVILLDTHCALWIELAPEKLSTRARSRIRKAENSAEALAISCVSLWEIAQKNARRQLDLSIPCSRFLEEVEKDFVVLPLNRAVVLRAAELTDPFPKDPMDRLIAGTALANDLTLITADEKIQRAAVCKLLW
jgi:PIN domain nuclease of toxin-antitoxin system